MRLREKVGDRNRSRLAVWLFVEKIKSDLGFRAMHREASQTGDAYMLRERSEAYAGKFTYENDALTLKNTIPWNKSIETTDT